MGETTMTWSGLAQAATSLVNIGITWWLIRWIHTLSSEHRQILDKKSAAEKELLLEQIRLKDEEIALERRAHERYVALVEEERRVWHLQTSGASGRPHYHEMSGKLRPE